MPSLLSGSTLRRGGSGEFIDLKGAMPQLPPSPTTSTGYTVVTNSLLQTTYSSSLGNIEFNAGSLWSNILGQQIRLIGTDTLSVVVSGGTTATSTNSGALVVEGGLGIWGDFYVGGSTHIQDLFIDSTASSYSTTTGALVVKGGVGIGENVYIGGILDVFDSAYFHKQITVSSTATFNFDAVVKREFTVDGIGGVNLNPQAASVTIQPTLGGTVNIWPGLAGNINNMIIGASTPQDSHFLNSYANNFIGLATTATNLEKGALGSIPYQTASGQTDFIGIGAADTVLVSNGSTATWSAANGLQTGTSTNALNVFINSSSINTSYHVILSTATNEYGALVQDPGIYYDTTNYALTIPNLTVTNTATVIGSVYSADGIPAENNLLYTPRVTISTTAPANPRIGDFWIDPTYGVELQWIDDGGNKFWIQFTGF
jgi:hypothetical protein